MMRAMSEVRVALVVARWTGRTASSLVRAGAVSHLDGMGPTGAASRGWSLMAAGEGHGGPARGYAWQPFAPGHTLSTRHGAYSRREVDPLAAELTAAVLAERPALAPYASAVRSWADLEARAELVRAWLDVHGTLDEGGRPQPATHLLVRLEAALMKARAQLGLDPRADAQLARERAEAVHLTADLDGLAAAGRAALEARERAEVLATTRDTDGDGSAGSDDSGRRDDG
jgi:hypothetical protein